MFTVVNMSFHAVFLGTTMRERVTPVNLSVDLAGLQAIPSSVKESSIASGPALR
jgi:hypothetical protein